jgi:hypothetical protein
MTRDEFFATVGPALYQFLAIAVPALLAWIGVSMQRLRNKQSEFSNRDALHKALRTGVVNGMAKFGPNGSPSQIIDYAILHAKASTPDALAGLEPTSDMLTKIASAYMTLEGTHTHAKPVAG